MPPKPSTVYGKPAAKKAAPLSSKLKSPPAKSISSPKTKPPVTTVTARPVTKLNIAPLKTGVERPVLRAFECLVNVETALKAMQGVGIYVGPDSTKQKTLTESVLQDLAQLRLSYQAYWKQVGIVSEPKS